MYLKKMMLVGIAVALMATLTASPINAREREDAGVIKKESDTSWDITFECRHFIGAYHYTMHQVANEGNVITFKSRLKGWSEEHDICQEQLVSEAKFSQNSHILYFKDTGETKLQRSSYKGKGSSHGQHQSYKFQLAIVHGELKMIHFWVDGKMVF